MCRTATDMGIKWSSNTHFMYLFENNICMNMDIEYFNDLINI